MGLLTAITDSAADAIFVSDSQGRVTRINPAAEKIFGWSREELTGKVLHESIHSHHPDGQPYPASECALGRVYLTGETLLRHEDVFFRKDGSQVQVACSNAPLMIDGRIAGSVLVAHDITDRKRREQALRESEIRMRALLYANEDRASRCCPSTALCSPSTKQRNAGWRESWAGTIRWALISIEYCRGTR